MELCEAQQRTLRDPLGCSATGEVNFVNQEEVLGYNTRSFAAAK